MKTPLSGSTVAVTEPWVVDTVNDSRLGSVWRSTTPLTSTDGAVGCRPEPAVVLGGDDPHHRRAGVEPGDDPVAAAAADPVDRAGDEDVGPLGQRHGGAEVAGAVAAIGDGCGEAVDGHGRRGIRHSTRDLDGALAQPRTVERSFDLHSRDRRRSSIRWITSSAEVEPPRASVQTRSSALSPSAGSGTSPATKVPSASSAGYSWYCSGSVPGTGTRTITDSAAELRPRTVTDSPETTEPEDGCRSLKAQPPPVMLKLRSVRRWLPARSVAATAST